MDAGKDTAEETDIPCAEDILEDIAFCGVDGDGDYCNAWGVTDNCYVDYPLLLMPGKFTEVTAGRAPLRPWREKIKFQEAVEKKTGRIYNARNKRDHNGSIGKRRHRP